MGSNSICEKIWDISPSPSPCHTLLASLCRDSTALWVTASPPWHLLLRMSFIKYPMNESYTFRADLNQQESTHRNLELERTILCKIFKKWIFQSNMLITIIQVIPRFGQTSLMIALHKFTTIKEKRKSREYPTEAYLCSCLFTCWKT